jgi:hypothetical protein
MKRPDGFGLMAFGWSLLVCAIIAIAMAYIPEHSSIYNPELARMSPDGAYARAAAEEAAKQASRTALLAQAGFFGVIVGVLFLLAGKIVRALYFLEGAETRPEK